MYMMHSMHTYIIHINLLLHMFMYRYVSVTPEEIRYVRPQVAPNELGQGGSTARQVLTKFCTSYWYMPARLLLFFVHLFYRKAVLPTDNYIAVPAVLYRKWLYVIRA